MAYQPNQNPTWAERDGLDPNDSRRIIKGADFGAEFNNIKAAFDELASNSAIFASCKFNGTDFQYGYNIDRVEKVGNGAYRVNFITPINPDGPLTAGDFAGVVTPYTTNARMVIASITDQREAYVDIVFRELNGSNWEAPTTQGFAFMLIDQVPS
jgi:hypothetical protein